jgi:methionyl-tRNA formyltransferase
MRIIFCGTPHFAVPSLRQLLAEPDFEVLAVMTQPDRPRGRGQRLAISPVKEVALAAGAPVFQPAKLRTDEVHRFFVEHAPDAVVIIAYGRMVPADLLPLPPLGWINVHASLLPHYRGAAPIQWAVLNGETRTGITTMQIDAGLDTGPVLEQLEFPIGPDETTAELTDRLAEAGPSLLITSLRRLQSGNICPVPQNHADATFARPLKKQDGEISWDLSAGQIYNRIRGLQPWPGAYSHFRGRTCHIWGRPATTIPSADAGFVPLRFSPNDVAAPGSIVQGGSDYFVACGEKTRLCLEYLQMEGRKRLSASDFANGARYKPGEHFE